MPASTDPGAGAAGSGLRRGLHGSLDLPGTEVTQPSRETAAGWVFHEHAEILLVLVTANGRVVATAGREIARPDVAALHHRFSDAARAGWSTDLDLPPVPGAGRTVTIAAHALVDPGGDGPGTRRTVMLQFAERIVELPAGYVARGEIVVPHAAPPGPLRVSGTADIAPGLGRVELSVDGGAVHTARHTLPSERIGSGTEQLMRGFSGFVDVPEGASEITVRASVVSVDGRRGELPSRTVRVEPAAPDTWFDASREQSLADALDRHVGALRATAHPGGRVLVATHDLHVGGAQNYLDELMSALHREGVEFCVTAGGTGPLRARIEETYDAPVLVTGPAPQSGEALAAHVRLIAGFAAEHGAVACLANTLVTYPAILAAQRLGLPSLWAIHESFPPAIFWQEYLGHPPAAEILRATHDALRACDDVMFEAESTRRLYGALVRPEAASLVPYGLDTSAMAEPVEIDRSAARELLGIGPDTRALVCIGTMEPRKGQLSLARAYARTSPSVRAGSALHLVGASDNAYSRAVRDFVADAGLEDVHVVPVDPEILRWYVAADVLVSASDIESMPRTMLEAMLAGRAVAATAAFGVAELVEDGVSGWLCEPGDLAQLTALIERALTTPRDRLSAMGAAARAKVLRDHDSSGYIRYVADRLAEWAVPTDRGQA